MAVGRISEVRLAAPPDPPKGRLAGIRLIGTPIVGSRGRVGQIRLTGEVTLVPKGRIAQIRMVGSAALTLAPMLTRTVEPLTLVEVVASLAQGSATDYVFRVVSQPAGAAVQLSGTGVSRVLRTPGLLPGGTVVIGVRATNGAASSPEVTATINVRPQIEWARNHDGLGWRPGRFIL